MSDHALRFMSTLKRSRDIDKSLQSLYNTATEDGESPAKVLKTAETFLPGLEETVDFTKFKKTSPPTTKASLLANNKRLPAWAAAKQGDKPAAPTMAAITA